MAVLLGRPDGDDWDEVITETERIMEGVRRHGVARKIFKAKQRRHRRGKFYVLKAGFTKGPGQKVRISSLRLLCILYPSPETRNPVPN